MEVSAVGEKGRKKVWMKWEDEILKRWVRDGRQGILEGEIAQLREKKGDGEVVARENWLAGIEDLETGA